MENEIELNIYYVPIVVTGSHLVQVIGSTFVLPILTTTKFQCYLMCVWEFLNLVGK